MTDKDTLYAAMFEAYHDSLKNFCIFKGVRQEDVDDIVSEAFTRAIAHGDTVASLTSPQQRAWLYSAVVRIVKEYRSRKPILPFSEIENIENYIKENDELTEFQTDQAFQQYVKQLYDALDNDKERELFRLIFDKQVDYNTLAKKYGYSPGTMRVVVSRFRKKLRSTVNKILN